MAKSLTIVIVVVAVFNLSTGKKCVSGGSGSDAACLVRDDAYMSPEISFIQARTTIEPVKEETGDCADCKWEEWELGDCSVTCGGGSRTDTRKAKCKEYDAFQSRKMECNEEDCPPIDCVWNPWQLVGGCGSTCGPGTQNRTRTKKVEEANGGTCSGEAEEIHKHLCNIEECPKHCKWGEWIESGCSGPCGFKEVYRYLEGDGCTGSAGKYEPCLQHACPTDCVWGPWQLGGCSATCGPGVQNRTREKKVLESNGGTCSGEAEETNHPCEIKECPSHCTWGEWQSFPWACSGPCDYYETWRNLEGDGCKGSAWHNEPCKDAEYRKLHCQ